MKVKDIANIMEISNDSEVIIHHKGEWTFIRSCYSSVDMHKYDEYEVTSITLSGYGGACLYIDVE